MKILTKQAQEILDAILKYDRIVVFRHTSPDYDALGSQFGMVNWLKHNFPEKEILAPGFAFIDLAPDLYPKNDEISVEKYKEKPFLALVLDTATSKRVSDENYKLADMVIKIDHHPNIEKYGDINLVREGAGAASELITYLLQTKPFKKYKMNKEAAKFFFSGIVGDTGRFQFSSTSSNTMKMATELLKYGFNPFDDVYTPMYMKGIEDFERSKAVMNNYYISEHGVAYYILSKELLKELNMDSDEAKAYLGVFSFHEGINVWVCLAEDERENNYRGSVRSRKVIINKVCAKYGGGGHDVASGCRPQNKEDIENLIKDLDKEVVKQLGL